MKRNFAYTAVSVGSRLLVGLLLFLLLARMWGPAQFGLFSFVFSVTALLALIVDFGFALYLLREISAQPDRAGEIVGQAFHAKLRLLGLTCAAALLLGWVIGRISLPPLLFVPLLLAAAATSFAEFFVAPLRALGRFGAEAVVVTAANALHFALAGGVAWLGGSPSTVAWTMVLSRLIYLGMTSGSLIRVLPGLDLRVHSDSSTVTTLRRVLPYGLDGMLYTALSQIDVVLVRMLYGVQAAGLYSAGQKIVVGVSSLAPIVGNVMIPRLTGQAARRDPIFWRTASWTAALMAGGGAVLAVPLVFIPGTITHWAFGPSFADLETLLPWFGGILLARYIGVGAGLTMTTAGLQFQRVSSQFLGLLVLLLAGALIWATGARMHVLLAAIAITIMFVSALNAVTLLKLYLRSDTNQ